jgi:hypothetical protein
MKHLVFTHRLFTDEQSKCSIAGRHASESNYAIDITYTSLSVHCLKCLLCLHGVIKTELSHIFSTIKRKIQRKQCNQNTNQV